MLINSNASFVRGSSKERVITNGAFYKVPSTFHLSNHLKLRCDLCELHCCNSSDPTSLDKPDPDPTSQDKPDPDPDPATSVLKIFHLFYDEF